MGHFDKAVEVVLKHEGGLVDHPNDPGGLTNFGISARWAARANMKLDIRSMTKEIAIQIYRKYFWDAYNLDRIQDEKLAVKLFDTLVNVGPAQAFRFLQRSLRCCGFKQVTDDGVLGPVTLAALNLAIPNHLICSFRSEQAGFYRVLAARNEKFQVFLKGWLKRAYDE